MAKKHLIIGCGTAGLSAAKKIRSIHREDEIKLVTMEHTPPYSPAALPYLLSGRLKEEGLWVADDSLLHDLRCELAKGKEIVGVIPEQKEVLYKDGGRESFDTLLIASGSDAAKPPVRGINSEGFMSLHTYEDCQKLSRRLNGKKEVTVYGGGMVALETVTALLERGLKVRIVVRSRIARGYFDEEVGTFIEGVLRQKGAEISAGNKIEETHDKKDRTEIVLSDGRSLQTDLLINCIGVEPRMNYLKGTGILTRRGVLVDKQMRTNLPDIYAAGDVAEAHDFFFGQMGINAIAPTAIQQGKVAGANMAGEETEDRGWIPMNVFRFFGHTTFSIGLSSQSSSQILKQKDKAGVYKELVFQEDRLVGARFVDADVDPGVFRYLIEEKVDVGPYKERLWERPREMSRWLAMQAERD
jgi:phenylglyoxylate dehydrogenase epsilon subunit